MLGTVYLKRYKVLRPLAEGGMSKLYLGMQTDPPREVVIKVLRPELASQPRVREHFRREIHILSKFHHQNSVTFFDADADGKQPVLVMEYLRGVDLMDLLQRHKQLSPERVGRLLGQMCSVLQAAHDEGIVHRDIKPANFFVVHPDTPQERIKLMDFGLAKMQALFLISAEDMQNSYQPRADGTPEYISPEQIKGGDVDRRSDLYSIGVILYELLSGRRPFDGDVEDLLRAHSEQSPPRFPPGLVPPAIERVVRECLEKYPEDRPQSADQLAQRYEEALGKKIVERSTSSAPATATRSAALLRKLTGQQPLVDRNAVVSKLTATMPESMAVLKVKGFINDLGGQIVESVPGLIRVRLGEEKKGGLFGWMSARKRDDGVINMELTIEKPDPTQSSRLDITLKLTSATGIFNAEGRGKCEIIGREFQAYLMGR